jgi:predicted MFS family arabinose efflux permease
VIRPLFSLAGAIRDAYKGAFSGLNGTVWLLAFASLINRAGTMVLPFLVLYLTEDQGFSDTAAGQALAVYGLGAVVGSYFGGWLCDRIPPRLIMISSLVLTAAGFLTLERMDSRPEILAAMFLLSVVGEAFRPANFAAVAAVAEPGRITQSFSLIRLAINIGMTLGPAVGGFLALRSYSWLFQIDALTCLSASVLLLVAFRPAVAPARSEKEGAAGAGDAAATAAGPVRSPWGDPFFLALVVLFFVLATVLFQISSTYPLTLRDVYSFSEDTIGVVLAINTFLIVLFEMVIVHAVREWNQLRLAGAGCLLFCLGFGLLPFGAGLSLPFAYVAATVVVWSFGEMLSMPISSGLVANRADERSRGRYMGLYLLAFSLAFVVAPLIGTWIYQHWGARTLWILCAATGVPLWAGFYGLSLIERRSRAKGSAVETDTSSPVAASN